MLENKRFFTSIKEYFILGLLVLIAVSGVSLYFIAKKSSDVQAQGGGASDFYISPNAPAVKAGWQDRLQRGQTTVLDPTSSLYNTYNGYSGEYDLWEYREELETTADGWDTVEHTYKTYYEKIENYWGSTEIADPKDPDKTILVPVKRSRVIEDNQNADPFENNPNVGGIRNQTPYLVLGDDYGWERVGNSGTSSYTGNDVHGKSTDFYDNILELDLWIPVDSSKPIHSLRIQAIDLCNHGGDHNDIGDDLNGRTEYDNNVKISIKGLHNTLEVMNGNDVCNPGIRNPIDRIIIKSLPTVGIPRDTKTFYFEGSQGEYEQYTIIAELTKEKSVYINQFKIEILDQSHALLVVPETVGLADKKTEDANTLNLSNRILSGGYGHYKIFWEAEIYVATDTDHGCSYETENYIGIFDSDYPSSTFGWVSDNAYAPRADVYSVDRNKFLDDSTNNIFTLETTDALEFDGYVNGKERTPNPVRADKDVSQNAWEDKIYEFSGDKIYRIHFYNIPPGTWIQIRVPFNQINTLEKCLRKPLVKVYYSDISAGGRFGLGGNLDACVNQDNPNSQTSRPNDLNTVVANVYTHGTGEIGAKAHGSSAQYGAKVHDEIIGFYSDFPPFLMGKGPPNSLKGLTFANSVAPIWGGQFGGRGRCMPNYWRGVKRIMDTATTRTTLNIGALTENNVEKLFTPASGQFTLTNSNATDLGLKATIYVEGDLLIENDIYNNDTTQFNKFNEIGYIYLIAKGDIFINPNVTRIDAILVAYTDNPITDGRIFTCNFDNQGIDINTKESPDPLINPNIQNRSRDYDQACNQKLIVDGALIGREIHLGRTFCEALTSTCSDPRTDQVGEEINLSPEYFISTPQLPEFSEWLYSSDSITVLPTNF